MQLKIKDRDSLSANEYMHTISCSRLCLSTDSNTSISDSLPTQDNNKIIHTDKDLVM